MLVFLKRYQVLVLSIIVLVGIINVVPTVIPTVYVLLVLAFFTYKKEIPSFLILFYLVLLFSDSRQEIMWWARDAKIVATLFLPINLIAVKNEIKFSSRFTVYLMPFLVIAWITVFYAFEPIMSLQKTLAYTLIVVCIPALFLYCYQHNRKFLLDLVYMFTGIFLVGIVLIFLAPNFVLLEATGRFTGLLGNPNGMGIFITVVFLYYQAVSRSKLIQLDRKEKIVFFIVLFYSLYLCKSRTAMMTVIIFYALNAVYNYSHFFGWIAFGVIAYMWSEILEAIPLVTDYFGFSEDLRVESVEKIKRGSGRDIAWMYAWQNIKENIFLGHGLSSTEELFRRHIKELSILGHQGNAHNTFLTLWYDTGLHGLIAFIIGLLAFFLKVGKTLPFGMPILFSILFSISYESWLSASLNPYTSVFFIIVTLLGLLTFDSHALNHENVEVETEESKEEAILKPAV